MPIHQQIIWTALPTGVEHGFLTLSVFVAPRLFTDGPTTLESFEDFAAWPAVRVKFRVRFGGGPTLDAEIVNDDPVDVDRLELYQLLFPANTPVRHRTFKNLAGSLVASYPALAIADWIEQTYTGLALTNPPSFPGRDAAAQLFYDVGLGIPTRQPKDIDALEAAIELTATRPFIPPLSSDDPHAVSKNFLQLRRFHKPHGTTLLPFISKPKPDFHEVLGMLGEYPTVLRIFRFIFDLRIPLPSSTPPLDSTVQVLPTFTPVLAASANKQPRTQYRLVPDSSFRSAARDPQRRPDGLLGLDRPEYGLIQIDHGGSAEKVMQFADNLSLAQIRPSVTTTSDVAAPSLRAGGISIARTNQAGDFLAIQLHALTLNDATPDNADEEIAEVLFEEDVTRGVVVDVFQASSAQWHSLLARQVSLRFQPGGLDRPLAFTDEHWVSTATTKAADGSDPNLLYLQETFVHWSGFSLAASRPGLTALPKHPPGAPLGSASHEPLDEYQLRSDTTPVPGSLPRLRFGSTYFLRARTVDLAGNRRSPSTLPSDPKVHAFKLNHAAGPLEYWRFEPVQTPPLLYRSPPTEGETLECMVIRTNVVDDLGDDTPARFPYGPADATSVLSERHIVPPGITQRMCEKHGLFDDTTTGAVDGGAGAYALIVARDGRAFPSVPDPSDVVGMPPGATAPVPGKEAPVPYFPDILARGVALLGLPGDGPVPTPRPFDDGEWPGYRSQRLVLRPGSGAPDKQDPRVVVAFLPPGGQKVVQLSAFLRSEDLDVLGIWQWILAAKPNPALFNALKAAALSGRHWMLTPARRLRLLHAVRKPLVPATFQNLRVTRDRGQTFAHVLDEVHFSRISTGKVELVGEWVDKVDDGPGPPDLTPDPFDKPVTVVASNVPLERSGKPSPPLSLTLKERHEFYDTKHRKVTYSTVATTLFKEHFVARRSFDVAGPSFEAILDSKGVVPGSVAVRVDGTVLDSTAFKVDAAQGQFEIEGLTSAARLEVSYLVPPISQSSRPAQKQVMTVPSSARPSIPKVLYVVPTFRWNVLPRFPEQTITSQRQPAGLRVWLERPWWSSGEGELLGVVLWPGAEQDKVIADDDALKGLVSQWGSDPVVKSAPTPSSLPRLVHFPLAVATDGKARLILDEVAHLNVPPVVNVAGHEVVFDDNRKLWFCDIDVAAGTAYFPFVRLALARYQPDSLGFTELSRVVLADFVQVAPNRACGVVFSDDKTMSVTLTGTVHEGTTATISSITPGVKSGTARVRVEKRIAPDELGWATVDTAPMPWSDQVKGWRVANLQLPDPRGVNLFRLIVEQFDIFRAEPVVTKAAGFSNTEASRMRLVYSDVIPL